MRRRAFIAALFGISTLRGIMPRFEASFSPEFLEERYQQVRKWITAETMKAMAFNLTALRAITANRDHYFHTVPKVGSTLTVARPIQRNVPHMNRVDLLPGFPSDPQATAYIKS